MRYAQFVATQSGKERFRLIFIHPFLGHIHAAMIDRVMCMRCAKRCVCGILVSPNNSVTIDVAINEIPNIGFVFGLRHCRDGSDSALASRALLAEHEYDSLIPAFCPVTLSHPHCVPRFLAWHWATCQPLSDHLVIAPPAPVRLSGLAAKVAAVNLHSSLKRRFVLCSKQGFAQLA
ncbi:hypothetical protein AC028_02280 [Xanthomonas citri pv. aurantifolii]|nr:hypothetical protein AC028_02280 [Xanthomonas citri pv. aurantifolii]ARE57901.1 hypothetical protein TP45_17280 [Xanthomonas citri pv. aurantifolii]